MGEVKEKERRLLKMASPKKMSKPEKKGRENKVSDGGSEGEQKAIKI